MKKQWLFYIDDFTKPLQDTYWSRTYWFKSFKVYWAYRWWICEQMDIKGVLDPQDRTQTKRLNANYAEKYKR